MSIDRPIFKLAGLRMGLDSLPKLKIEYRIDYTNQVDAPAWYARTYLNSYHMNGDVNFG